MIRRWHIAAASLAWTAAAVALLALGQDGPLSLPSSWRGASKWYESIGPATATVALIRVVAMGLSAWLAAATAMQLAAACRAGRRLRRAADGLSPRWLSEVGRGVANISLSASLALPAVAPLLPTPQAGPTTTEQDHGGALVQPATDQPGIAVMRPLPDADPVVQSEAPTSPATVATTTVPAASPGAAEASPAPPAAEPGGRETYVVEPGDSCWSIAEQMLTEVLGRRPEDRQTAELWRKLIELNGERFATGDPDLLFVGQTLLLPPAG